MKALLYVISLVLLDAIVPRSCRNESGDNYQYYEEDGQEYYEADTIDSEEDAQADSTIVLP